MLKIKQYRAILLISFRNLSKKPTLVSDSRTWNFETANTKPVTEHNADPVPSTSHNNNMIRQEVIIPFLGDKRLVFQMYKIFPHQTSEYISRLPTQTTCPGYGDQILKQYQY